MRALLDPNVLISALLAPTGSPAKVFRAWLDGSYELVVSPLLLEELERALGYRKIRERVREHESAALLALLRRQAQLVEDPADLPVLRSPDPGDDYLIALAGATRAVIVSGDGHLLGLARQLPIYSPAAFLTRLEGDS
ncbi:MAG: putative toxin-antitoxin system toxin component, PIN family [Candidatus Dormiibacterota bacterium]